MQPTSNLVRVRSHTCAKKGLRPDENQDSVYPPPNASAHAFLGGNSDIMCVAVADGATESYLPGLWSAILTSSFRELRTGPDTSNDAWENWIIQCRQRWQAAASAKRNEPRSGNLSFAEIVTLNSAEAKMPAAATFAGLRLYGTPAGETLWDAWVLGDSCLFHLRENQQKDTWPYKQSREFSYTPYTALSYPNTGSRPGWHIRSQSADQHLSFASPGDVFLLATDALAKWILKADEQNTPVWGTLLRDDLDLEMLVHHALNDAALEMENDDASLVVVTIGQPHAWCLTSQYIPQPKPRPQPTAPTTGAAPPLPGPVNAPPPASAVAPAATWLATTYPQPSPSPTSGTHATPTTVVSRDVPSAPQPPPFATNAAPAPTAPKANSPSGTLEPTRVHPSPHRPTSKHWLYSQVFRVAYFSIACTIATVVVCSLFYEHLHRDDLQQQEERQREYLQILSADAANKDKEIKRLKEELEQARRQSPSAGNEINKISDAGGTGTDATKTLKPNAIAPSPTAPPTAPAPSQPDSSGTRKSGDPKVAHTAPPDEQPANHKTGPKTPQATSSTPQGTTHDTHEAPHPSTPSPSPTSVTKESPTPAPSEQKPSDEIED